MDSLVDQFGLVENRTNQPQEVLSGISEESVVETVKDEETSTLDSLQKSKDDSTTNNTPQDTLNYIEAECPPTESNLLDSPIMKAPEKDATAAPEDVSNSIRSDNSSPSNPPQASTPLITQDISPYGYDKAGNVSSPEIVQYNSPPSNPPPQAPRPCKEPTPTTSSPTPATTAPSTTSPSRKREKTSAQILSSTTTKMRETTNGRVIKSASDLTWLLCLKKWSERSNSLERHLLIIPKTTCAER